MKKISIVIPAHNEEKRIKKTLEAYHKFFAIIAPQRTLSVEFIIVLNACTDKTLEIVQECAQTRPNIIIVDTTEAGKGLAIKKGFANALTRENDVIGFVDADMATDPRYFYELIMHLDPHDGIIGSRYMPGAYVSPHRPLIKTWGRKLIYNSLVHYLFDLNFHDYQCGAKLFKRHVLEQVNPRLTVNTWAFDVELLYICSLLNFSVHELPTIWFDQAHSKLDVMGSGLRMLSTLFEVPNKHKDLKKARALRSRL